MPRRFAALFSAAVLLAAIAIPVLLPQQTQAAQLQSRKLSISSSANGNITTDIAGNPVPAGQGGNGQQTKHSFTFTFGTSGATDGSILIMYCDDPIPQATCTTPTGFNAANVASVALTQGTTALNTTSAYTVDTGTSNASINTAIGTLGTCNGSGTTRTNCIALKRCSAQTETGAPNPTFAFGGGSSDYITNPTSDNQSFFARIFIFSDTGWTKANLVDMGSVAASTAQQIDITAKVKEVLNFSVSATASVAPGTTCTPLDGTTSNPSGANGLPAGGIYLGDTNGVLSFNQAYDAHSYFRLSSNTNGGVKVYYSGDTLKNGSNQINPAGTGVRPNVTAVSSTVNSSQFGLAIDSSDTQGGNGYSFTTMAAPSGSPTNYSAGNGTITTGGTALFAFDETSTTTPVMIASSAGPVACDTGSVRYLGNISTATPAGIYTTTITYIATGTY